MFKKIKAKVLKSPIGNKSGMEMVQVAILIAIAVIIGLIFKTEITSFVNDTFDSLQDF
ncbi:MAG: Flp1 family type IVb pilin [Clostridiales bacterium]|nr:Flp1 family type IVb pilin [Clostridiales bacterium]MDY6116905.1 Flp1 family type IVb pilin [Anaerovoracaceae bacterium]